MPRNASNSGDLVLGNRHLLLIFFAIFALSGVFFALGYIVGRNTFSPSASVALAESQSAEAPAKPSPMPPAAYFLRATPPTAPVPAEPELLEPELRFDQTLGEQTPEARLESAGSSDVPDVFPDVSSLSREPNEPNEPNLPNELNSGGGGVPSSGILVQVSALTRREDAETLLQLLGEKNLPVMVTPGTSDSLYHIVIGPYQTEGQAQQVKRLLEEDGFQPILKR